MAGILSTSIEIRCQEKMLLAICKKIQLNRLQIYSEKCQLVMEQGIKASCQMSKGGREGGGNCELVMIFSPLIHQQIHSLEITPKGLYFVQVAYDPI